MVKILSNNAPHINWWARKQETIDYIKKYKHNPNYLSDIELPLEKINPYSNLKEVIAHSNILLIAVPSAFMSESFKDLTKKDFEGKMIFSLIKGTLPDKKLMVSQYFHKHFEVSLNSFGMIAGPCHAEEVALEKLSYLTVACSDQTAGENMAKLLSCRYIKACTSNDMQGIEYTAALKNIYAVASGICHGLGNYGDNFQAVLVANAIQEISRFINVAYPNTRDTNLSAYLGDLLVTAYSQFSRNRMLGSMVGKGYSVKYAQMEMNMVAEGYYAVKTIYTLNQNYKVEMPICDAVYRILYEKMSPSVEIRLLAERLA
ncbi:MAG TPA: NAD(P)H-dependent glycerol-3-phosphate dehydrogenase [Bacteroidia bacterium]|nr:NAD(P)H-dependent glycerol-3-phosphate dehydrogenase [Bacteroidia bacterium]